MIANYDLKRNKNELRLDMVQKQFEWILPKTSTAIVS
jgi:hypothetical protein